MAHIEAALEQLQIGLILKEFGLFLTEISEGKVSHKYYAQTVEHAEDMGVHVEGLKPTKLLTINRPNETPEVKKYRLDIWQPVTDGLSEKVVNTLNRIYNERFFKITFDNEDSLIGDDFQTYLTEGIPEYGSLMNYIRETFTKKNLSDANGAIVVMPTGFDVEDAFLDPEPVFYESQSLKVFKEGNYYFFFKEDAFFIVTKTHFIRVTKKPSTKREIEWEVTFTYPHSVGVPPVFRTGGIVKGDHSPYWYHSFIAGVLPHWNRVVTLSSDLDGNYNSHMHMERWSFVTECDECQGAGKVNHKFTPPGGDCEEDNWLACKKCDGTGDQGRSPYGEIRIRHDALQPDQTLPTPPAAYLTKPTEIVGIIENRIKDEEVRGFSSINFEILAKVGENQSGIAKVLDRQDMDSFLRRYADHVFNDILPRLMFFIAAERYGVILNHNMERIEALLPDIQSPKNFNVLSLDMLTQEYKEASTSNVSDSYLKHIEKDIAVKQFVNNETKKQRELVIIDLQPFPGKSPDQLLTLGNLGIEEWEIYKSIKLGELVDKAIEENKGFLDLERKEQREVIDNMAKEARPTDNQVITAAIEE